MMKLLFPLACVAVIAGCSKVPVSGRRQMSLLPESQMIGMASTAYGDFLAANPPLPDNAPEAVRVRLIGEKIALRVEEYLKDEKQLKRIEGFEWEFKTVNDPAVNAWCMPGGKVVVYTGILAVAENDAQLATVMGHEIAHAIARHGNERMSKGLLVQAGGATLSAVTSGKPQLAQDLFMQSYGVASGLGMLKYSRKHETEADKMGLIFMAMAGYDPKESVKFWGNMAAIGGDRPPEILSTHPSSESRIVDLEEYMGAAMWYYNAYADQN
jgi:predicted Zn-dependent protease